MQLEEPFKTLELFLQKNYLQSSPSFIVSVFNLTKRVHPALLHMPCQIALADDWQLLTLCNLRPLRTATDLIHIFLTSLNELALGLIDLMGLGSRHTFVQDMNSAVRVAQVLGMPWIFL